MYLFSTVTFEIHRSFTTKVLKYIHPSKDARMKIDLWYLYISDEKNDWYFGENGH